MIVEKGAAHRPSAQCPLSLVCGRGLAVILYSYCIRMYRAGGKGGSGDREKDREQKGDHVV